MNTIIIDDEVYTIMKRSEYVDVCQSFINDGIERERVSRKRNDSLIMGALRFYAGDHNYLPDVTDVVGVEHGTGIMQYDSAKVFYDGGQKARDAIAAMEG